ncbi:hypothetical protein [Streptomyces sp. GQFP]|uniref:hypothetical protein n=1 Tax=Streptomyces sp. GQFP TaxID=2907545 RepID=UPI001F2341EB|nr:hypothetical protein [Streptomyces sp. GQFP]UIX35153.1 hypothetical protein LUX31_36995 [Streptomyces sp. GQFP]
MSALIEIGRLGVHWAGPNEASGPYGGQHPNHQRRCEGTMRNTSQALSATEPAVLHAFKVDFVPAYSRVRHIRRITAAHLRLWDLPSMIEPATLVVSELVTNASAP